MKDEEGGYMNKVILFSAIGGHDPIASYHDGALLHICRNYQPQKVYLYYSQEMLGRKLVDNRYEEALFLLQNENEFEIEEIYSIEKSDLKDVHRFDEFYEEFDNELKKISAQNPECEILVNLSSGTPAMKNALNLIATLSDNRMKAIQVSSPNYAENPKADNQKQYDLESYWECNEDREKNFQNRCEELTNINLLAKIKKEIIIKMIEAYDYGAAVLIAEEIEPFLSQDAMKVLRFSKYRVLLDKSNMSKQLNGISYVFIPIQDGKKREIFEYLLVLQLKQQRGDYTDFIRGITPIILDLFEECLKKHVKINIKDFCTQRNRDKVWILSESKFNQTDEGIKYKEIILKDVSKSSIDAVAYSERHILALLNEFCEDKILISDLNKIIHVEKSVRNVAAHEIVSVTDEWIKARTTMNTRQILELLKKITIKSGFSIKNEYWNTYDEMNAIIKELLR